MNTHNVCFRGEIRKISIFSDEKKNYLIWSMIGALWCKIRSDMGVNIGASFK